MDANDQKDPQGLKQRFAALIDAELAPKKSADVTTAPKAAAKVVLYEGKGVINHKIPVALWFDSRDGLVSGEIVYTATKARKPIRILGREEADGAFRLYEKRGHLRHHHRHAHRRRPVGHMDRPPANDREE